MLDEKIKAAVEFYQCPGCVHGSNTECYEMEFSAACAKHTAGTVVPFIGTIFLGMPIGFNRLGPSTTMKINIFREFKDGWKYDLLNVPIWKYLDDHGNTIVRGMSPRVNVSWIHIFLTDCLQAINCLEVTRQELAEMD